MTDRPEPRDERTHQRGDQLASRLRAVRERIAAAVQSCGRPPDSVGLVAVSKRMPPADVLAALSAGQRDFGENYAQELRDKRTAVAGASAAGAATRWHFIGPLQANKVKYIAGKVALVHTVDSVALLDEIDRRAAGAGAATPQACLIQVNVAGEERKHGVAPRDLPALLDRFAALAHVHCEGLMLIPPLSDDPQGARPHFAALRALRDDQRGHARPHVELRHLSMGMSHDFEVAITEGATLVRVGTAIFGDRS